MKPKKGDIIIAQSRTMTLSTGTEYLVRDVRFVKKDNTRVWIMNDKGKVASYVFEKWFFLKSDCTQGQIFVLNATNELINRKTKKMKAGIRKTIEGLKSYMLKYGYTGLYCPEAECVCEVDDLAPCGEDHSECKLGWRRECTPEEAKEYDFVVENKKPDYPQKQIKMKREDYEKDLKERQRKHLEAVHNNAQSNWRPCMHDGCPECLGTGIKRTGGPCIHMISCPCPKCTPTC